MARKGGEIQLPLPGIGSRESVCRAGYAIKSGAGLCVRKVCQWEVSSS